MISLVGFSSLIEILRLLQVHYDLFSGLLITYRDPQTPLNIFLGPSILQPSQVGHNVWLTSRDETVLDVLWCAGKSWSSIRSSPDLFNSVRTALEPFSVFTTDRTSSMKSRATLSLTWCSLMMTTNVLGKIRPEATHRAVTWARRVRCS